MVHNVVEMIISSLSVCQHHINKNVITWSIISGTNIVIEACLMNNVKRLVQTSSVDAVSPLRDCFEEDEDSLPYLPESELAMPEYASTKMKAEKLVLGSHGRPLADGRNPLNCREFHSSIALL